MPIGLFIAAAAMGATGIGISAKAAFDQSHAKALDDNSTERLERASNRLEDMRKKCNAALQSLGEEKVSVLSESILAFLDSFTKLKNVDFSESVAASELNELHIDQTSFSSLREMSRFSQSITQGATVGVMGGALAALGAYSAASACATASTGTAIATLSGAAAKSATLAWFGGGAISAGGSGIAGGTAVLGSVVAGPALLLMGVIVSAKAGKNLENARSNSAETTQICEQLENGALQCIAIRCRTYMFYHLLARLDAYFMPLIYSMEKIISSEGTDYSAYSPKSKRTVAAAAAVAVTIKSVLDTPILDEDGSLTTESDSVLASIIKKMNSKEDAASL